MTTNLSINECTYDQNSYAPIFLNMSRGPCKPSYGSCGYRKLNPQLYTTTRANDFCPAVLSENPCRRPVGWTAEDARLKTPRTGNIPLVLDTVPMDMSVGAKNVYSPCLNAWQTGFSHYDDIRKGQITYYNDSNISDAFHSPVFQNEAATIATVEPTPMNGIESRYHRIPLKCRNCLQTSLCRCSYLGGLSWIEDSNEQRENIIASQMGRELKRKWSSRWPNRPYVSTCKKRTTAQ